jgi:uncharacterized OB-fold protein
MAIRRADFPLPDVEDPLTAPFFAAASRRELVISRCAACDAFVWYPTRSCLTCAGDLTWTPVSGRGALFSWAVVRRAFLPAFADKVPFVTALVAIEEDPTVRLATYICDADPATLVADQRVQVDFRPLSFSTVPDREVIVPVFVPRLLVDSGSASRVGSADVSVQPA